MEHEKRVRIGKILQHKMGSISIDRSELNPCLHRDSERHLTGEEDR